MPSSPEHNRTPFVSDGRARRLEEGMTRTAAIHMKCMYHTKNTTMTNSKDATMYGHANLNR